MWRANCKAKQRTSPLHVTHSVDLSRPPVSPTPITPQTYDKKLFDKKSWVKNHPFWDPNSAPYVKNPYIGLRKFLGQPQIWRFLNSRLGCTKDDLKSVHRFVWLDKTLLLLSAVLRVWRPNLETLPPRPQCRRRKSNPAEARP